VLAFVSNNRSFKVIRFDRMLRIIGSSIDGCAAAGAEATKACVREIFRHCSQVTGAVSAVTLDLVHSRGYYAGQASRFNGRAPRQESPPPPSASTFRGVVNKTSGGSRHRFYARFLRKLWALFWIIIHALFSLFLPRSIFGRIMGDAGYAAAGSRLRRAPSELNFQTPSPASTGFLEDACVLTLSFIDRSAAILRRSVRYVFGLNKSRAAHASVSLESSAASSSTSITSRDSQKSDDFQQQQQQQKQQQQQDIDASLPHSDISARFGLSVSSIVCKAG
jgi:hypothetical protein